MINDVISFIYSQYQFTTSHKWRHFGHFWTPISNSHPLSRIIIHPPLFVCDVICGRSLYLITYSVAPSDWVISFWGKQIQIRLLVWITPLLDDFSQLYYWRIMLRKTYIFIWKQNVYKNSGQSFVWDGKGKDRVMLIKSLITARVGRGALRGAL